MLSKAPFSKLVSSAYSIFLHTAVEENIIHVSRTSATRFIKGVKIGRWKSGRRYIRWEFRFSDMSSSSIRASNSNRQTQIVQFNFDTDVTRCYWYPSHKLDDYKHWQMSVVLNLIECRKDDNASSKLKFIIFVNFVVSMKSRMKFDSTNRYSVKSSILFKFQLWVLYIFIILIFVDFYCSKTTDVRRKRTFSRNMFGRKRTVFYSETYPHDSSL